MPDQSDYLRHDLTALYGFVESITGGIAARRASAAYSPAAELFFIFVSDLANSCRRYIAGWSIADDEEFEDRRAELEEIRGHWRELHKLIKPALDADTLQVPSAVVDGIIRRFQELPGYAKTRFALFHTSEFNYLQVHTSALRSIATTFRAIIPDAPTFPDDLGLIGMPYSQGRTAFANCLVAHEIGHYRYRGTNLEQPLKTRLNAALKSLPSEVDQTQKDVLIKRLTQWAEELFCDLFGVMLIGPCYTYAYIEAYDLSVILDYKGAVSSDRFLQRLQFYAAYPSHIFRLQQQSLLLRESKWWGSIDGNSCRSAVLLRAIQDIPIDTHIDGNQVHGPYIRVLEAILPDIRDAIGNAFDGVDDGFVSFSRLNPTVLEYLANGIVPSTLNVRAGKGPEDVTTIPASPLVLLNSGMQFYLTCINDLMRSIPGEEENRFDRRLHWVRRVEEWVAKAIEDESLGKEVIDVNPKTGRDPAPSQT